MNSYTTPYSNQEKENLFDVLLGVYTEEYVLRSFFACSINQLINDFIAIINFWTILVTNFYWNIQEYLDFLRSRRRHEMESLARKYRAIGPLLTKMEGLVAHTNTGRSPALQEYYQYWEKRVFDSLLKV